MPCGDRVSFSEGFVLIDESFLGGFVIFVFIGRADFGLNFLSSRDVAFFSGEADFSAEERDGRLVLSELFLGAGAALVNFAELFFLGSHDEIEGLEVGVP